MLQSLLNSAAGVRAILLLGRVLPLRAGYALANFAARQLAARPGLPSVQGVRLNQWVVRGQHLSSAALDAAVLETFQNIARSLFELYHFLPRLHGQAGRQEFSRLFAPHPAIEQILSRAEFEPRGLVLVGLHLGNFDLALQGLCRRGLQGIVLTIPHPQGGRQVEAEIRRKTGMRLLPTTVASLRAAVHHLQQGGTVLTGIDRPVDDPPPGARPAPSPDLPSAAHVIPSGAHVIPSGARDLNPARNLPLFFGHPSALPSHHVYLAMKANVPIQVLAVCRPPHSQFQDSNAKFQIPPPPYHFLVSPLIEMDPAPPGAGRAEALLHNTEKVLRVAADFIRPTPGQWGITLPVWPGLRVESRES